ncbi:hypothetical protein BIV57_10180 [Mangrovactinospora gilvigrisea]|uniref:Polymerase nucleotidyl transferase domain-containing protein n=1 Tax=Mangrovactinospora gilvigrisea TaxID=1428644 RepID=A0A1J7BVX5_9ACTN|nr:nucleotidyltransferase domain-containing protein [Mangrovactinospora gilvigrisea]OIV37617.1 hypothetical protein BIV57_10180 [Mangrovactinospora gilvigrisea]
MDPLAWQERTAARAAEVLAAEDGVLAVYLIGSMGAGEADRHSDVDVHCVVADEAEEWFRGAWKGLAERIVGPVVLVDDVPGLLGGLAVTPQWQRLDLAAHRRSAFDRFTYDGVRVLHDPGGEFFPDGDQPRVGGQPGEAYWPERAVRLFYYLLGTSAGVRGREEWIVASQGAGALRDLLIELLLAERGVRRAGGVKRLNAFLGAEARKVVEGLPSVAASRESVERYFAAAEAEFTPRARALAERLGVEWPAAYVDATLAHAGLR